MTKGYHPYIDTSSQDDLYFIRTLNSIQEYIGISNEELSNYMQISLPTLERWKNGKNLPHRAVRKHILQYLDRKAFEIETDKNQEETGQ